MVNPSANEPVGISTDKQQEVIKQCDRRLKSLQAEYDSSWRDHYIDITENILPRTGRYLNVNTKPNDGTKANYNILDCEGTLAHGIASAGMQTGMTSPSRPWFRTTLKDRDLAKYGPVKIWLEEVRNRLLHIFSNSNFYNTTHQVFEEITGFGTGSMIILPDPKTIIRGYAFTVGEYYLGLGPDLRINTIYRVFWMQAGNMIQEYGKKNVSDYTLRRAERDRDSWVQVVHAIEPNWDRDWTKIDSQNMPFRSVYYEYNTRPKHNRKILRYKGFLDFPVMAPRWSARGSEIYADNCPGMTALADIKSLQEMEEQSLDALEKLVNPPMSAPASMEDNTKSNEAGSVTYVPAGAPDAFKPTFTVKPDFEKIEYKSKGKKELINRAFHTDLFLIIAHDDRPNKTATEVSIKKEEKLLMIGPVIERVAPEMLDPAIKRTFFIAERMGLMPPRPEELGDQEFEIEHISILAQAQKLVQTAGLEQIVGFVKATAEVIPEAVDKLDADESIDKYSEMVGTPPSVIRSDEKVDGIRKSREEEIARERQAQELANMTEGAKTMSETDTGGNNALTQLMAGLGAPPQQGTL